MVAGNDGFGNEDLAPFAGWSAVYSVFLVVLWPSARWSLSASRGPMRHLRASLLGAGAGLLFTIVVGIGLGPWVAAFSFPVGLLYLCAGVLAFSLGAALEPPGQAPRPRVRAWAVVGAFLLLPVIGIVGDLFLWGRAIHTRYELSPGYVGPVIVVYDVPGASPLLRDRDGFRVPVPTSGVVVTSTEPNRGWRSPDVLYTDASGSLPVATDWPHRDDTLQGVRAFWLGGRGRVTLNGEPQPFMEYEAFAVAPRELDRAVRQRHEAMLDSLWPLYAR